MKLLEILRETNFALNKNRKKSEDSLFNVRNSDIQLFLMHRTHLPLA